MIIGLTGPSGSGKSTVASFLKEKDALVLDADKMNHSILENDKETINKIIQVFGRDILTMDKIDRQKLGAIVFNDEKKRKKLTDITHPVIVNKIKTNLSESDNKIKVIDAPLLIEADLHHLVDFIWVVLATKDSRLKRLMKRDNRDKEELLNRLNSQPEDEFYIRYADKVFYNNSSKEALILEVIDYLTKQGVSL